jgi:hypothetical protein
MARHLQSLALLGPRRTLEEQAGRARRFGFTLRR